jgi:hypothetical protein
MSLQSLIDNPKELLELINEYLKPKDIEKNNLEKYLLQCI